METNILARKINYKQLGPEIGMISGQVPISELKRVQEVVVGHSQYVNCEFRLPPQNFSGKILIIGSFKAEVEVICQRCLERLTITIDSVVDFVAVRTEQQARTIDTNHEPLIFENEEADLWDYAEEEILLSIPYIPLHEPGTCELPKYNQILMEELEVSRGQMLDSKNPFRVLKDLDV